MVSWLECPSQDQDTDGDQICLRFIVSCKNNSPKQFLNLLHCFSHTYLRPPAQPPSRGLHLETVLYSLQSPPNPTKEALPLLLIFLSPWRQALKHLPNLHQ